MTTPQPAENHYWMDFHNYAQKSSSPKVTYAENMPDEPNPQGRWVTELTGKFLARRISFISAFIILK